MKHITSLLTTAALLLGAQSVLAQVPPPPPPPDPLVRIDEVNAMVLVDLSGSMAEEHASGRSKLDIALERAARYVVARLADYNTQGDRYHKPLEFALWAFDGSFPSGDGYTVEVRGFPSTAQQVLAELGYDANLVPTSTRNAIFTPTSNTPLAAAGCFAGTELVAELTTTGGLRQAGYEWNKELSPGVRAQIERRLYLATDGLENATPAPSSDYDCGGITSTQGYANFEPDSWQAKLRNKLLTGNPSRTNTLNSGLVVDVDLLFANFVTGLGPLGSESGYAMSTPYSTAPTLEQALEFYGGLSANTLGGTFHTVTVSANGSIDARYPGDVDYSGCVGNADYSELLQWYGQAVTPLHPHSYWADLDGDGWVDYLDYLILAEHWGEGGTC